MHRASGWLIRGVILVVVLTAAALTAILFYIAIELHGGAAPYTNSLLIWLDLFQSLWGRDCGRYRVVIHESGLLCQWAVESRHGFGRARRQHLLLRVRAYRRLEDSCQVTEKRYHLNALLFGSAGFLLHSRIYSCGAAIQYISSWMVEKLTGGHDWSADGNRSRTTICELTKEAPDEWLDYRAVPYNKDF